MGFRYGTLRFVIQAKSANPKQITVEQCMSIESQRPFRYLLICALGCFLTLLGCEEEYLQEATLQAFLAEVASVDVTDGSINSFGNADFDLDLTVTAAVASLRITGLGNMVAGSTNELVITAFDRIGSKVRMF